MEAKSFVAYAARFAMPAPASGVDKVWYSIDVAGVHWITLSNYHDFSAGSPQTKWLAADLAAIDRKVTPWVFVQTHAPWYNSNTAHQGDGEAQREVVEPMLYAAGVDMVMSGHVHAYERSHRAYKNKRDAAGPVYITIGDGGNREGLATKWGTPTPVSALRVSTYGHGEIVIYNATTIGWEWHGEWRDSRAPRARAAALTRDAPSSRLDREPGRRVQGRRRDLHHEGAGRVSGARGGVE